MLQIDQTNINIKSPPYMISEIGLNHNGDIKEAIRLIDDSRDSGCNAVKFQLRSEAFFLRDIHTMEIGQQYVFEYIKETYLNFKEYEILFEYAKSIEMDLLVSCWDIESLLFAHEYGIKTLKIASADLTNKLLIDKSLKLFKNIIMSTGMSSEIEIEESIHMIENNKVNLCILHCSSTYPAPVNTLNLNYISKLKKKYKNLLVGYSGHELEYEVCLSAQALGAVVFEKHLTRDKNHKGNDHKVSLLKDEMRNLVKMLNNSYLSLGSQEDRIIQPGEKMNRVSLGKSLTLNRDLKFGEKVYLNHIDFTYGGNGIPPNKFRKILKKKLNKNKYKGELLEITDFDEFYTKDYFKQSPINNCLLGIPVRYHDAELLYDEISPDFLEFHLSYKDIQKPICEIEKLIKKVNTNEDNTFHAPDFYKNDLIFDPINSNNLISQKSDEEFRNFLNHIEDVLKIMPNKNNTKVITSFSSANLKDIYEKKEKDILYQKLNIYLDKIKKDYPKLNILPQTLPVNAWYLGGRRFVNIFANPIEILNFCRTYKKKLCLDTAHTIMACNYYKLEIEQNLYELIKYADHIHLVDAKGDSDEGLTFGLGDLNLQSFVNSLKEFNQMTYIPEIWQGHHNRGQGFKDAINILAKMK